MIEPSCSVDGCQKPARRAGYCWGHVKQLQRTGKVQPELQDPRGAARDRAGIPRRSRVQQLEDAAIDYADANSDGDQEAFDRARHRLLVAADRKRSATADEGPRPRGRPPTGTSRWARWRRTQRAP